MRSQAVRGAAWVRPGWDVSDLSMYSRVFGLEEDKAGPDLRFARLLSKKTVARFDAAAVAEGFWIRL